MCNSSIIHSSELPIEHSGLSITYIWSVRLLLVIGQASAHLVSSSAMPPVSTMKLINFDIGIQT